MSILEIKFFNVKYFGVQICNTSMMYVNLVCKLCEVCINVYLYVFVFVFVLCRYGVCAAGAIR